MKNSLLLKTSMVILITGFLFSMPLFTYSQEVIDIQVSPSTLNLQNNGQVVTVHTEIAYSLVVAETVSMNGIEIDSWKADDRGNFVAKFIMEAIIGLPLVIGDYNELTLEGTRTDGSTFIGTDQVMVIDVVQKGKK
jgi:hypothetical protein